MCTKMLNVPRAVTSAQHFVKIHLLTTSNSSIDEVHAIGNSSFSCSDVKKAVTQQLFQYVHVEGQLWIVRRNCVDIHKVFDVGNMEDRAAMREKGKFILEKIT